MRIVEKLVMGDDGLVQLLRTEDSSVGSKYVYEEMSYAEYSRIIQLLSVIVLQEVGRQAQAKGVRAAAIEKSQRLAARERPLWSTAPALYAEMLPLMSDVESTPENYQKVLLLPVAHPLVRELARLLHQSSYRFMAYQAMAFPDLNCLAQNGTQVRFIRGLQPLFQAAARRGDAYDSTASMGVSAGKALRKMLPSYEDQATRHGFSDEWSALMRWADYLMNATENPLRVSVFFTAI